MRLIDADALYDKVLKMGLFDNRDEDIFIDAINEQPTAYDVDKVVEELHHCGAFEVDWEEKMAIDIVKRGGVDD